MDIAASSPPGNLFMYESDAFLSFFLFFFVSCPSIPGCNWTPYLGPVVAGGALVTQPGSSHPYAWSAAEPMRYLSTFDFPAGEAGAVM